MRFGHITLRKGTQGPAVANVRRQLFRRGYLTGADGSEFDDRCLQAVKKFQLAHGLAPDGIVGRLTWHGLYASRSPKMAALPSVITSVWEPVGELVREPGEGPVDRPTGRLAERSGGQATRIAHGSGRPHINISITDRTLALHDGFGGVRTFSVAVGTTTHPTPTGNFTVAELHALPGGLFGTRFIRLHPGTCHIHGTDEPWSIGAPVTPGCVRLHNKDAEIVFHRVHIGTNISIT